MSTAETNPCCPVIEPSLTAVQDNGRRMVAVRRSALRRAALYRCWASSGEPLFYAWVAFALALIGLFTSAFIITGIAWTNYLDPESEEYYDDGDKVDILKGMCIAILIFFAVAAVLGVSSYLYAGGHCRWNDEIPRLEALSHEVDAAIQKQDFSWPSKYEERLRESL